jgi:hypothetical protein
MNVGRIVEVVYQYLPVTLVRALPSPVDQLDVHKTDGIDHTNTDFDADFLSK